MVFDPEYFPISELFSNSDTLSSYSLKFDPNIFFVCRSPGCEWKSPDAGLVWAVQLQRDQQVDAGRVHAPLLLR